MKRLSKKNKIYIFGDNHTQNDWNKISKEIENIKPDFVLVELMYEDEVWNKEDVEKRINESKIGGLCNPELNQHIYEFAKKLDVPFIGVDIDSKKSDSLKDDFKKREAHMVEIIKDYMVSGTICVVVGDTHLRTIKTEELGDISLIQKEFSNNPNVTIIRSENGEIK